LEVITVKEAVVSTDREWYYVVHYLSGCISSFLQALGTERVFSPECFG